MVAKKTGLGKGLDSLIPTHSSSPKTTVKEVKEEKQQIKTVVKQEEIKIKITEIEPNREQPRKKFDEDALLELAESIKQFGVIQP